MSRCPILFCWSSYKEPASTLLLLEMSPGPLPVAGLLSGIHQEDKQAGSALGLEHRFTLHINFMPGPREEGVQSVVPLNPSSALARTLLLLPFTHTQVLLTLKLSSGLFQASSFFSNLPL